MVTLIDTAVDTGVILPALSTAVAETVYLAGEYGRVSNVEKAPVSLLVTSKVLRHLVPAWLVGLVLVALVGVLLLADSNCKQILTFAFRNVNPAVLTTPLVVVRLSLGVKSTVLLSLGDGLKIVIICSVVVDTTPALTTDRV